MHGCMTKQKQKNKKTFIFISLFSAPYRDCAELLNAGIRNTGVHTIVDKNWVLPVYCDQDYMGGGKCDFMWTHFKPTFHHDRLKIPTDYFTSVA